MSFFTPTSFYRYTVAEGKSPFLTSGMDLDESDFKTDLRWYKSKDGTKVSMFLLSKRDVTPTSETPVSMTGYGGFGVSLTPSYNPTYPIWAQLGGVVAIPHLRGGAEYGREWHHAGNREKKQNVFDDFIAAAEYLIASKIGSKETLTIYGGSNGGLLVGAALVQKPKLYSGVYCAVPLLDMIRYTNFLIAKYWIPEYGDPEIEEEFNWLLEYSPYHHVKDDAEYPSTFFYTAIGDGRVDPMHALKMTALVQANTSGSIDEKPVFLWVETDAGHGVGMPLEKRIDVLKKQIIFLAHRSGIVFPE
jgi:prolyl oligopeptidase